MSHPRRPLALALSGVAAATAALALVPAAHADQTLPGGPLAVTVGDLGQLQGRLAGSTDGIFYAPSAPVGDAGFFLAFPTGTGPVTGTPPAYVGKAYGFDGAAGPHPTDSFLSFTARGQDGATGTGTAGDPRKQVTRYAVPDAATPDDAATDDVTVTQTTTYVDGTQTFDVSWEVKNQTTAPLRFKALAAADFYFEGDDSGTGIFTQGPPRFIGGTNADTGRSGGFLESPAPATPWTHYQALRYGGGDTDVWGRVENSALSTDPSFDDSVVGEQVDNAGATEWDQRLDENNALPAGQSTTFSLTVRTALPAALAFDKTNAGSPQGVPITYVVNARDTAGTPYTGKLLRYTIGGANAGAGAVPIDANGNAVIVDPGANAGPDTIIAFLDLNGNGSREPNEPQGSALGTFVDNVPPKCTVAVSGSRVPVGKPLSITVTCDSPATVTSTEQLKLRTKAKRKTRTHKRVKARTVKLTLPAAPAQAIAPGATLPLTVTAPKSVNRRYAGLKATATITVTAVDAAGNQSVATDSQSLRIAKIPAKKKKTRG